MGWVYLIVCLGFQIDISAELEGAVILVDAAGDYLAVPSNRLEVFMMPRTLDLREAVCPFTQLKAIEAFHELSPGESLRILVRDPTSVEAIVGAVKGGRGSEVDVGREKGGFVISVVKRKGGESKAN